MKKDIMLVNQDVIKRQDEAAKAPNHPINDGLRKHFEERKRKLDKIKESQSSLKN